MFIQQYLKGYPLQAKIAKLADFGIFCRLNYSLPSYKLLTIYQPYDLIDKEGLIMGLSIICSILWAFKNWKILIFAIRSHVWEYRIQCGVACINPEFFPVSTHALKMLWYDLPLRPGIPSYFNEQLKYLFEFYHNSC